MSFSHSWDSGIFGDPALLREKQRPVVSLQALVDLDSQLFLGPDHPESEAQHDRGHNGERRLEVPLSSKQDIL